MAEACKWTYTHGAVSGSRITGNRMAQVNLNIELFGVNRTDNSKVHLVVHESVVSEGADLDFAATDFFKPNFSGTLRAVLHRAVDLGLMRCPAWGA